MVLGSTSDGVEKRIPTLPNVQHHKARLVREVPPHPVACDFDLAHLEYVFERGSVCGVHAQVSDKKGAMEICRPHEC